MGRYSGSNNSLAFLGQGVGSQVLQAKAGPLAINVNDVVALGGIPAQLYPVQSTDYAAVSAAGAAAVALTSVSPVGAYLETRDRAILDQANGDIFIADTYNGSAGSSVGCRVWKYNFAGQLQRAVTLDDTGAGTAVYVQTMFLSNGNILVFWAYIATPYTLFFAIVDKALNVIVPRTAIDSAATNPQSNASCVALSGGGFAIAWAKANVGSYFTIRNNAGAVVYPPTLIAGAPANTSGNANGPRFKLAQLSNGNIFVGINDVGQGNQARYCIFTPAGAAVRAYTEIAGGTGGQSSYPEVDVVPGFVCMAIASNRAYVFNNAGDLQGMVALVGGNQNARLKSDGTYFWAFSTSSAGIQISRIATNSTNVTNTLAGITISLQGDVLLERGQFVVFDGANAYVIGVDAVGFPVLLSTCAFAVSGGQTIGGIGDFCAIAVTRGQFAIIKYLAASVLGVAKKAVAAGSAGTLVEVNAGPGGFITNEIRGAVAKAYDHSGAAIMGNKGTLLNNSVVLKGF